MSKFSIIKEFLFFLRVRKKWWLIPIVVLLLLLGALIILTEGSAISPFIYTLVIKNMDEWGIDISHYTSDHVETCRIEQFI